METVAEYTDYQERVASFIERQGIKYLSTGTSDPRNPEDTNEDAWFSWSPCECCNGLAGSREYLFARSEDDTFVSFEICVDCVYYINYGRLDDTTMLNLGLSS